jgi:hypothetical protein
MEGRQAERRDGRNEGRREGRKEGRKGERRKGRQEGRKEDVRTEGGNAILKHMFQNHGVVHHYALGKKEGRTEPRK